MLIKLIDSMYDWQSNSGALLIKSNEMKSQLNLTQNEF